MLNQILLVGTIKEIKEKENQKDVLLVVERPFRENEGKVQDVFVCRLWNSIFAKIISLCAQGDIVAIRGRVNVIDSQYLVMGESVVILNKSKNNILKSSDI